LPTGVRTAATRATRSILTPNPAPRSGRRPGIPLQLGAASAERITNRPAWPQDDGCSTGPVRGIAILRQPLSHRGVSLAAEFRHAKRLGYARPFPSASNVANPRAAPPPAASSRVVGIHSWEAARPFPSTRDARRRWPRAMVRVPKAGRDVQLARTAETRRIRSR